MARITKHVSQSFKSFIVPWITGSFLFACSGDHDPAEDIARQDEPLGSAPGSLIREGDVIGETATLIDATDLTELVGRHGNRRLFATAIKNAAGTLTVSVWSLSDAGVPTLKTSVTDATAIDRLAIVNLGGSYDSDNSFQRMNLVVATKTSAGNVRLLSFWITEGGSITLKDSDEGGAITEIAAASVPSDDPNLFHVGVPVRNTEGRLKVIVWHVNDDDGVLTRTDDQYDRDVRFVAAAGLRSPHGVLVTPVVDEDQSLALVYWKVSGTGQLTKVTSLDLTTQALSISATHLSYRRLAVASMESTCTGAICSPARPMIRTIDVGASSLSVKASAWAAGSLEGFKNIDIANGGGARLFLTGTSTFDDLVTIQSWEAIDSLKLTDQNQGGTVQGVALAVLNGSRAVTAVRNGASKVKPIAWQDYNAPLLRGTWPATFGAPIDVTDPPERVETFGFQAGGREEDHTIAAGEKYVVVGGNGTLWFYDKAGNRLQPKHEGGQTSVTYASLFRDFTSTTREHSLWRHLEFQYSCDPEVEDSATPSLSSCARGAADSRVTYAAKAKRFVVATHAKTEGDGTQHYFRFAVSKTEDPRDGFDLFAAAESVNRDSPRLAVAGDTLIVTYDGGDANDGGGDEPLRPVAFVYDMRTLGSPDVVMSKITRTQIQLPIRTPLQYGPQPFGFLGHQYRDSNDQLFFELYGFKGVNRGPITLYKDESLTGIGFGGALDSQPSLRFTRDPSDPNRYTGRFDLVTATGASSFERDLLIKSVPVELTDGATPQFSMRSTPDVDRIHPCPGRSASVPMTCNRPAITSDATGRVFVGFQRASSLGNTSVPLEARYVVFPSATNGTPSASGVLLAGNTTASPFVQFTSAVPDPFQGFWMVNERSVDGQYQTVAGRVVP